MPEESLTTAPAERAAVIFLTAETPVHAGSGNVQAALDLPIQRSVQTCWPIINDSTLRGAFRRHVESLSGAADQVARWFGAEPPAAPSAGALSTPDAEILLFPVAAVRGVTAWVTAMEAIEYFVRKLELFRTLLSKDAKEKLDALQTALSNIPAPADGEALVTQPSELEWEQPKRVVLEVDSYRVGQTSVSELAQWFACNVCPHSDYWKSRIERRFVVLPEHAFRHYTLRKTDVRTRVKLESSVVKAGPWTEENLPVDTVLYTVLAEPEGDGSLLEAFLRQIQIQDKPVLQLGGDQNLGRGFVRLRQLGA